MRAIVPRHQRTRRDYQRENGAEGQARCDRQRQLRPPLGRGAADLDIARHEIEIDAEHHGHQPQNVRHSGQQHRPQTLRAGTE